MQGEGRGDVWRWVEMVRRCLIGGWIVGEVLLFEIERGVGLNATYEQCMLSSW